MNDITKKNKTRDLILVFLFVIMYFLSSDEYLFSFKISSIPFIDTLVILLFLISLFIVTVKKKSKINLIMILLLIRFATSLISLISARLEIYEFMKVAIVMISSFLIFFAIYNSMTNENFNKFILIISLSSIIISAQVILNILFQSINTGLINKDLIQIPIGGSNLIASHLLVMLAIVILNKKRFLSYLTLLLGIMALIVTFSFGAIVTILIMIFIYLIAEKKLFKKRTIFFALFLVVAFLVTLFIGKTFNIVIINEMINSISRKIMYLFEFNFDRLTSERLTLYKLSWDSFTIKPIFGNYGGVELIEGEFFRPHNIFLEALSNFGMIGFVLLMICLFIMFREYFKYRKTMKQNEGSNMTIVNSLFYALLAGLIHSLVEPNFYTLQFEILWWSILAVMIKFIKEELMNEEEKLLE